MTSRFGEGVQISRDEGKTWEDVSGQQIDSSMFPTNLMIKGATTIILCDAFDHDQPKLSAPKKHRAAQPFLTKKPNNRR